MASEEVDYEKSNKSKIRAKWDGFRHFIWNSNTKEVMGRTGKSWAKIGLFYLVFYSCLAAFFAGMLAVFFTTIDEHKPTQTNMDSLIKGNPGMGFRPQPSVETTLITFHQGKEESYKDLVKNINEALEPYRKLPSNAINCSELAPDEQVPEGKVCAFYMEELGSQCTGDYGYNEGTPCVLLKINKVYGWKAKPYDNETLANPKTEQEKEASKMLGNRTSPGYLGITCEGENEADVDHLGQVEYFPEFGYPTIFFPYERQDGYMAPLVFAKFTNPRPHTVIQVWCKLWGQDIKHHKNDKAGSIHFELFIN